MNAGKLVFFALGLGGALCSAATVARAAIYPEASYQEFARVRYFDAHNHIAGILPYYAYANLPAYVAGFSDPTQKVGLIDKLELFNYLANTWYPTDGVAPAGRGRSEKAKVAPGPSFGIAHRRPWCASMMDRLTDRPMPMPSPLVV